MPTHQHHSSNYPTNYTAGYTSPDFGDAGTHKLPFVSYVPQCCSGRVWCSLPILNPLISAAYVRLVIDTQHTEAEEKHLVTQRQEHGLTKSGFPIVSSVPVDVRDRSQDRNRRWSGERLPTGAPTMTPCSRKTARGSNGTSRDG